MRAAAVTSLSRFGLGLEFIAATHQQQIKRNVRSKRWKAHRIPDSTTNYTTGESIFSRRRFPTSFSQILPLSNEVELLIDALLLFICPGVFIHLMKQWLLLLPIVYK